MDHDIASPTISQIKLELQSSGPTDPDYQKHNGLYFFLSLDLVGSTAYKTEEVLRWPYVIRSFYDDAKKEVRNQIHVDSYRPRVWKYVGDEVLFVKRLRSVEDAIASVEGAFRALEATRKNVEAMTLDHRLSLSVKGTCWTAMAEYQPPAAIKMIMDGTQAPRPVPLNVVFSTEVHENSLPLLDFLGPDIDTGFRLSQAATCKRVLVVGADLAWILSQHAPTPISGKMRIVDMMQLRGVWNGRYYPIIWYLEDWQKAADRFDYDDTHRVATLEKALSGRDKPGLELLGRILQDVRRTALYNASLAELNKEHEAIDPLEATSLVTRGPEVHCVAVCINKAGKILVARRPQHKGVRPGAWEFGCAQMRAGDSFVSAMMRHYRTSFGLSLKFASEDPDPVASYSFERSGNTVSGILFVADVDGEPTLNKEKHTEYKWIEPDQTPEDVLACSVPELQEHAKLAVEIWRSRKPPLAKGTLDGRALTAGTGRASK